MSEKRVADDAFRVMTFNTSKEMHEFLDHLGVSPSPGRPRAGIRQHNWGGDDEDDE